MRFRCNSVLMKSFNSERELSLDAAPNFAQTLKSPLCCSGLWRAKCTRIRLLIATRCEEILHFAETVERNSLNSSLIRMSKRLDVRVQLVAYISRKYINYRNISLSEKTRRKYQDTQVCKFFAIDNLKKKSVYFNFFNIIARRKRETISEPKRFLLRYFNCRDLFRLIKPTIMFHVETFDFERRWQSAMYV